MFISSLINKFFINWSKSLKKSKLSEHKNKVKLSFKKTKLSDIESKYIWKNLGFKLVNETYEKDPDANRPLQFESRLYISTKSILEELSNYDFIEKNYLKEDTLIKLGGAISSFKLHYDKKNRPMAFFNLDCLGGQVAVSYTHLTLPTSDLV